MRLLIPDQRELDDEGLRDLYEPEVGPSLRCGFVLSVDGSAALDGSSRPLSGPADRAVFTALRDVCDAVVVGAGTARAEGYRPLAPRAAARRSARGRRPAPRLVIISRSGWVPPDPPAPGGKAALLVVPERAGLPAGPDVIVAGVDSVDLAQAVGLLHERGLAHLLCEGGPVLATALASAGLVDEWCLTVSPVLVGAGPQMLPAALPEPGRLTLRSLIAAPDSSLLLRYSRLEVGSWPVEHARNPL